MKKKFLDPLIFICITVFVYVLAFILTIALTEEAPKNEPVQIVLEEYAIEQPDFQVDQVYNPRDRYLEELDFINGCYTDSKEWFEAYKAINEKYALVDEVEWIDDVYSNEEIYLLERVVETECHGADFDSKTHVAAVVLNRVENERFPTCLSGVIKQPNQFCYSKTNIDDETKLAVEYAFVVETAADDCLWFHSMGKTEKFSGVDYVFSDNCHNFYK